MASTYSKLRMAFKSLLRADQSSRRKRIERNIWCSENIHFSSGFNSDFRDETALLEQEARQTFIHGQFISALLVSVAYCEHTLSDIALATTKSKKVADDSALYIAEIKKLKIFNTLFWDELQRLKDIRNGYAHRKWESVSATQRVDDSLDESFIPHKNTLTARTRAPQKNLLTKEERDKKYPSPQELIEQDAKDALRLMDSVRHMRHNVGHIKSEWDD